MVNEESRNILQPEKFGDTLQKSAYKEIILGTMIVSDEWKSYACLKYIGFIHYTVNRSKNFVEPIIGYNI